TEAGILYLDEESLAFQVVNNHGYIWSSTIDYDQEGFAESFKKRARSALILESFNTLNQNYAITEENVFENNTDIDLTMIQNGFHALITFGRSKITIGLKVTYTQEGIHVSIPQDEIDESGDFKISTLKVYPYFGAVKEADIPGYVFIPDGIGALIDYKLTDPLIAANYQKEIYDRSLGYNTIDDLSTFISGGTRIYAPVFGFVHGVNQNAVFAHILNGDAYGMINVYFPARTRGYTTVFSEFVYRKTYSQPIDNVGGTISLLQTEANPFDIELKYTLLEDEDANYIGMAKTYRDDLNLTASQVDENIPLHLETIGLEKKQGTIFVKNVVMTTLSDMIDIVTSLNELGIDNIHMTLNGFTRLGVTWAAPFYEKMSSRLGNNDELAELNALVENLYFVTEYLKASSKSKGYNQYFDLAKKINDQMYTFKSQTDTKYLLEHNQVKDMITQSMEKLDDYDHSGLAIQSFGHLLYEDYANDSTLYDQIVLMKEALNGYEKDVALYDANSYMWDMMDQYLEFPMYTSHYLTFDDTVPFLSIVLSGTMPLYGPFANFYPYAKDELLRLIDFGVYPSFIVTQESSKALLETDLENIYSSSYDDIKPAIVRYYQFVNDALKHVIGEQIVNREVIDNGVVKVTYSSGAYIVINYLDVPYTYLAQSIDAKNYKVWM
ncbi:MAG: DUF5696 domain-containing protein, partial [Acholeplasmataceae bacterium]|nr:DUF5696 domain-containing protein [Acholeplasmataceae bacterium]